jgi:hypothetical protein
MTDQVNTSDAFQTKDKKGYIRSVSIILYSETKGFLLCDEMRKGFPNPAIRTLENHMIGGKCDMEDNSPIISGFREFIEETGYPTNGVSDRVYALELAKRFSDCKTLKWDTCVSPKKGLWNRFYVINIDSTSDYDLLSEIHEFITFWKKDHKLPLESIYWWKSEDELEHPSNLLLSFTKNLPPSEMLI